MNYGPAILVVDDTPLNVKLIRHVLAAEGFRVLEASNGQTARAVCRAERPDLVLLDVMMPGESGFATCALLKSDPATADIPVIFLSALDGVNDKVAGLEIGGVDYVPKPVDARELLARVRVHLGIREASRTVVKRQRERLELLRTAQRGILVQPEDCPQASFGVFFRPLEETGGDFYDVFEIVPGVFGYFVADVSGHGVSASFLTAAIKALLRQYTGPMFSPEDSMRSVDAVIRPVLGEDQYVTACYARLNRHTWRLSVVSAGHPPLVLMPAMGPARVVGVESEPLGVFSSRVLESREVPVSPGDRFFLFTDGLVELSPGCDWQEGIARLIEICGRYRGVPIGPIAASIAEELRPGFREVVDDLLLLAADVCP